jgi:uncharacterized protein (DUF58 family)
MDRQAWRDFFITVFFLGIAFVIALLSSVAAEQNMGRLAAVAAAISLLLALLGALYIIPRLARNVRLEILRFAVRTTVTLEGLLFIIFLAVIGFAAWNTGNNLLYLVLSAMLAFLIAANLIARSSLADVSVQLRFPDHLFAGEPANLTVTLTNHKRLMPSYSLMVEPVSDRVDEDESATPRLELGKLAHFTLTPSRASARQRTEYTFDKRGRYPITGFRISTKFPAGFFKKWRRIDANGEILVYPKPKPLDDFYHALPMLAGQMQSHLRGSGDDLYAIRRYQPSDQMRHIDWKATAKSVQMMVREHMREDEWRLIIVFDTSRPGMSFGGAGRLEGSLGPKDEPAAPPGRQAEGAGEQGGDVFEERFERAVVMAASLANHFILEGADVELITPNAGHNVASGKGYEHLYKILRSMATLQPADAPAQADRASEKSGSRSRRGRSASKLPTASKGRAGRGARAEAKRSTATAESHILNSVPVLSDERRFKVLITSAAKGTIPANVWRSAHVVFMEDL